MNEENNMNYDSQYQNVKSDELIDIENGIFIYCEYIKRKFYLDFNVVKDGDKFIKKYLKAII